MRLYIVHDWQYIYKLIVFALNEEDALSKVQEYIEKKGGHKRLGILFKPRWIVDPCMNKELIS